MSEEQTSYPPMPKDHWLVRRRMAITTLVYCAVAFTYLLIEGDSASKLHDTMANGLIWLSIGTLSAFIGGAVWDDKNRMGKSKTF